MPAINQIYKLKFEADSRAAQNAMAGLDASGRNFLATSKEIEKVDYAGIGRDLFNAARVGAGAIFDLASASSELVETQNFASQVFKDSYAAIAEWAETAEETALLTEAAALRSAASLGVFGQKAGLTGDDLSNFSINLVELAADMASVADTPVEAAVTAIGAAMRNEYEPLRKYSAVINEITLKEAIFEATGKRITGQLTQQQKILGVQYQVYRDLAFAVGDVERTSDEFANTQRRLIAEFGNVKAEIGDNFRPALTSLMEAASLTLGVLTQIPGPIQRIGATALLSTTSIAGLAGGALLLGTKTIEVTKSINASIKALNAQAAAGSRSARAMSTAAKGAAIAATAYVALEVGASVMNEINDITERTAANQRDLNIALQTGTQADWNRYIQERIELHKDEASAIDGVIETIREFDWGVDLNPFNAPGMSAQEIGEQRDAIQGWGEVLKEVAAVDPAKAKELRDEFVAMGFQTAQSTKVTEEFDKVLGEVNESIVRTTKEQKAHEEQLATSEAQLQAVVEDEENLAKAAEEAAEAIKEEREQLEELGQSMADVTQEFSDGVARADALRDALDQIVGTSDPATRLGEVAQAARDLFTDLEENEALKNFSGDFDVMTADGLAAAQAVEELSDIIIDDLVAAYKESNGNMKTVHARNETIKQDFIDQAREADLSEKAIRDLTDAMFATPEEIETAVKISGDAVAQEKIRALNLAWDDIPEDVRSDYVAAIDAGEPQRAWDLLQTSLRKQGVITAPTQYGIPTNEKALQDKLNESRYYASVTPVWQSGTTGVYAPPNVRSMRGAAAPRPDSGYAGYADYEGAEPRGVPAQVASVVGPGTNIGTIGVVPQGGGGSVTINMPVGTDERRVMDLIRRHTRQNGALMLGSVNSQFAMIN